MEWWQRQCFCCSVHTDDGYEFLYLYFHILSANKKLPYRNIIPTR